MADAHRRFENLRAGAKAKLPHRLPHSLDDERRGEVRIRGRGARGLVFVFREEFPELVRGRLPFPRRIGPEGVRHRSPARVSHEDGFLRICRVAIFRFDLFEGADGFDVGEGFFAKRAFADMVACCYPEVAGGGFFFRGLESADDRCGRSSLGGKAHSWVTVSHAAW